MRRLPVFFCSDCSESMVGQPLESVQEGVEFILSSLRKDPYALETVYVSVIAYAGIVRTLVPLTELFAFNHFNLPLGGGTHLGKALDHLGQEIDRYVMKTPVKSKATGSQWSIYLPMVVQPMNMIRQFNAGMPNMRIKQQSSPLV